MTNIVQAGDKVLRRTTKEVPLASIKTAKIKGILKKMTNDLGSAKDGVALAASQIGIPLRIFIVLKEYTENRTAEELKEIREKKEKVETTKKNKTEIITFINPKIVKLSKKKQIVREGCLSVANVFGTIIRAEKATVWAYNEKGKKFSRGASGLLAQIIQHEMDHLNGVLFTDTAYNLEKLEKNNK